MLLKFTVHAQGRLDERNFSVDFVKKAIKFPDIAKPLEDGLIKVEKKLPNARTIVVIYKKESFRDIKNQYLIITAYFLNN